MSNLYALALVSIFVILVVVSFKSLKQAAIFSGPTLAIVAICVALLAVLGLMRFDSVPENVVAKPSHQVSFELDLILIPYAALAIAVLITLLLWLFLKLFGGRRKSQPFEPNDPRRNQKKVSKLFLDQFYRPSDPAQKDHRPIERDNKIERQLYRPDKSNTINRD